MAKLLGPVQACQSSSAAVSRPSWEGAAMRMFLTLLVALALAPEASAQVGPERLTGRFDTLVVTLRLRGEQPLGTMENDCVGSVGRRPALVFDYDPGDAPARGIEVRMVSATDTVLAVLVPGERFDSSGGPAACSDDEGGDLNPLLLLESPIAGRYTVLAGPLEAGVVAEAVLTVRAVD